MPLRLAVDASALCWHGYLEGVFVKSLQSQIVKQSATGQIEVVTEGPVDAFVKVPPAHLMEDRAARTIKAWLRHCGQSSDDASAAKALPKGKPRAWGIL